MKSVLAGKSSDFLKIGVGAAGRGDLDTLKQVLDEKPNWYLRVGSHGRTMLWESAYRGRGKVVNYLLNQYNDLDIEARGCYYTPMLLEISPYCAALTKNHAKVAESLLNHGARYDVVSACYLGNLDFLQSALADTPSLLQTLYPQHDPQGPVTLLHYAVARGHEDMSKWLISQGSEVKSHSKRLVHLAIASQSVAILEQLFGAGADVSGTTMLKGEVPNESIAKTLAANGVNLDIDASERGWPSLVYICRGDRGGNPAEVKRLLKQGADVNVRNYKRQAALHCAAKAGFVDAVKVLIANQADINALDEQSNTPLHTACTSTIKDGSKLQTVIDLLIEAGADTELTNKQGRTAVDIVKRRRKFPLNLNLSKNK